MHFLRLIPTTDSITFRGWARKLQNYLKQLSGSKLYVILDIYSNEGNKNSLSKWRATSSQECKIEDLSQNPLSVAGQILFNFLNDRLPPI